MLEPDDILRVKLKEGDLDAYKSLFETYYRPLVIYGFSFTQNEEESRELVQELFLKLWENRKKNTIRGSVKAYIFTALYNLSLNWLRHYKIRQAFQKTTFTEMLELEEQPKIATPFLTKALNSAIEGLPSRAREVFTKTQIEGISIKETARILGISDKTVENQVTRSKKILRKKLRHYI